MTSYNSCRNRNCPKCQYSAKELWVSDRVKELLPVPYYHMVFTVPHVLNELMLWNRKLIFDVLFQSSQLAVKKIFKTKYEATPGMISLLHTWGSNLSFHVHVHMLVTGGGIGVTENRWIPAQENYALSVQALSSIYRAQFLSRLRELHKKNRLRLPEYLQRLEDFNNQLDQSYQNDWVVYAKRPFTAPIHVLNYLGNYTHRIAFSNHRIFSLSENVVSFSFKDYAEGSHEKKVMTLQTTEFLRRYLMHIVPRRFVKIRFFGFMAHRNRKHNIERARELITKDKRLKALDSKTLEEIIAEFKKTHAMDTDQCPKCKEGQMLQIDILEKPTREDSS